MLLELTRATGALGSGGGLGGGEGGGGGVAREPWTGAKTGRGSGGGGTGPSLALDSGGLLLGTRLEAGSGTGVAAESSLRSLASGQWATLSNTSLALVPLGSVWPSPNLPKGRTTARGGLACGRGGCAAGGGLVLGASTESRCRRCQRRVGPLHHRDGGAGRIAGSTGTGRAGTGSDGTSRRRGVLIDAAG